jgi:hypothetical protein
MASSKRGSIANLATLTKEVINDKINDLLPQGTTDSNVTAEAYQREVELAKFGQLLGGGSSDLNLNLNKLDLDDSQLTPSYTGNQLPKAKITTSCTPSMMFGSNRANSDRSQSSSQREFSWSDIQVTREVTVVSEPNPNYKGEVSMIDEYEGEVCTHKTQLPDADGNFRCKCGAVRGTTSVTVGPMRTPHDPNPARTRTYPHPQYVYLFPLHFYFSRREDFHASRNIMIVHPPPHTYTLACL